MQLVTTKAVNLYIYNQNDKNDIVIENNICSDRPVCVQQQQKVYETVQGEEVQVYCRVHSNPQENTR